MSTREKGSGVAKRNWNWRIWVGFLVVLAALFSYITFFIRFPITRNVPWVNWLLFALAGWLLWQGLWRGLREPEMYRGKVVGPILTALGLAAAGFFGWATLFASRGLPLSTGAPRVGAKAPEFVLADTGGKMVALSALVSERMPGTEGTGTKPRGVLLIFYRGYW